MCLSSITTILNYAMSCHIDDNVYTCQTSLNILRLKKVVTKFSDDEFNEFAHIHVHTYIINTYIRYYR